VSRTIFVGVVVTAWIGLLLAWAAREKLAASAHLWTGELVAVASLAVTVLWPVLLYFLILHPDWSWHYLRAAAGNVTAPWVLLALALVTGALFGGWFGGRALVVRRREDILRWLLLGLAGLAVLLVAILHGRLGRSGTYDEYHAGEALRLGESKLGWVLCVAAVGVGLAVTVVARALRPLPPEPDERHAAPSAPPPPPADESETGDPSVTPTITRPVE